MLKFLNSSYFPDHLMDLVYIWYDVRYWFKVLFSNTLPPLPMAPVDASSLSKRLLLISSLLIRILLFLMLVTRAVMCFKFSFQFVYLVLL